MGGNGGVRSDRGFLMHVGYVCVSGLHAACCLRAGGPAGPALGSGTQVSSGEVAGLARVVCWWCSVGAALGG